MATIGLSKPYYAKYTNDGTTVTYSAGGLLGKYTELSVELNDAEDNTLYGDDAPDESDQQFSGGKANVTTNDLLPDVMLPILGLIAEAVAASGLATENPQWLVWNDDQAIPYVGLGGVIKKKTNGRIKWVAFVLEKIQFANPGLSAVTQGKTIEWQTQKLTATILRSDAAKHSWFRMSSLMDSAEDAEKLVKAFLNIPEATA